jgi:hypothetical protein
MKRPTLVVFVVLVSALVALVALQRRDHGGRAAPRAAASASAATAAPGMPAPPSADLLDGDGRRGPSDDSEPEDNADAGGVLGDGGTVPELVAASPKSVVFGVILIQYADAQGAPPGTRSRAEAEKLSAELAELAKKDFKAAVERGDPGSTTNAGRMFRGVMEPAPEFTMFSLGVGEVSAPVDTPRGLWIIHRME